MSSGMLWCEERQTDCFGMHGSETCQYASCVLDDPKYIEKEKEKEARRQQLFEKEQGVKLEEKEAAGRIRRQVKTKVDILQDEVNYKRRQMERFYTRGMTHLGDKASRELADLERQLEKAK